MQAERLSKKNGIIDYVIRTHLCSNKWFHWWQIFLSKNKNKKPCDDLPIVFVGV